MKDPILNIVLPLSWSEQHNLLAAELLRDFLINGGLVRNVPYMELIDLQVAPNEAGQELTLFSVAHQQALATVQLKELPEGGLCERLLVAYFYDVVKEEHFVLLDDAYTTGEGFYHDWWLVRAFHSLGLTGAEFEQLMPVGGLFDTGTIAMVQQHVQWFVANGFDFTTTSRPEGTYLRADNGEQTVTTFAGERILGGIASLGLLTEAEYVKTERFEATTFGPFGHLRVQNQVEPAAPVAGEDEAVAE